MHTDINRSETQSSYQRNMILGQIVAIILFVVPVWIFSSFSSTSMDPAHSTITNIQIKDARLKAATQDRVTKRNVGAHVASNQGFAGQFGVNFRIISDGPDIPAPTIEVPKIYALGPTLMPMNIDEDISISDLDTGSYGAYVPYDANYEFDDAPSDTLVLLNRGPELIYLVKPSIPPLAQDMEIGGVVEVLALIDPKGNYASFSVHKPDFNDTYPEFVLNVILKDGKEGTLEFYIDQQKNDLLYVTVKDEPTEFKFAKRLSEVLPKWRFKPAIKDGVPVHSFVYIRYNFCSPRDKDCMEFIISSS